MKNEFLQQDNFEQTGNFSLVGSFIEGSLEAAKQKQLVASMVKGGLIKDFKIWDFRHLSFL